MLYMYIFTLCYIAYIGYIYSQFSYSFSFIYGFCFLYICFTLLPTWGMFILLYFFDMIVLRFNMHMKLNKVYKSPIVVTHANNPYNVFRVLHRFLITNYVFYFVFWHLVFYLRHTSHSPFKPAFFLMFRTSKWETRISVS